MFDFNATLQDAERAVKDKDFAMATFHYWLIGFAYEDEEFPHFYTKEIGKKGAKGFLKYVNKYKNEILTAESYLRFKEQTQVFPKYQKYFKNFERVVSSFINKQKKNNPKEESIYDFDIF